MPRRPASTGPAGALPAELTSFVGRRAEIVEVRAWLKATRLVTLTGPGGVGKTRLALQVATTLARAFQHGVRLVELTDATPDTITAAIERAVPLDHLRDRELLLVLDNCEHLAEPLAEVVDVLLRGAPRLRVLATSRIPLGIRGERAHLVSPLTVPPAGDPAPARYSSVRLLIDRAHAAGRALTDHDLPDAAELCRRLDGLPLAIELAAHRLSVFHTLSELLTQLDRDPFRLLTGGATGSAPRRHRTLRGAIEWSHTLCLPAERVLWARLSVFAGDVDLPAAEAVCAGGEVDDVVDALAGLVRQSVLIAVPGAAGTRYRMLDTFRQYGALRLPERDLRCQRHADYHVALAERAFGSYGIDWTRRLRDELLNLLAAMDWCRQDGALRVVTALLRARAFGPIDLPVQISGAEDQVVPLALAAWDAQWRGDRRAGEEIMARAARCEPSPLSDAAIAFMAGNQRWLDADPAGIALLDDARNLFAVRDVHVVRLCRGIAIALVEPDTCTAVDATRTYLAECERTGAVWAVPVARWMVGVACWRHGNLPAATASAREALRGQHERGDSTGAMWSLELLAWIAADNRQQALSARLLAACDRLRAAAGVRLDGLPAIRAMHDGVTRRVGPTTEVPTYEQGLALALGEQSSAAVGEGVAQLTPREAEVALLVADGRSDKDIAAELVISVRTVTTHVQNILRKHGFRSRTEIVALAVEPTTTH